MGSQGGRPITTHSLSETAGRLLLHLLESETGLTEAELELRGAGPVGLELAAHMASGVVYRVQDRYHLSPGAAENWVGAELSRLGQANALYFAYGSNMDPWQVYLGANPVFPAARFLCRAELPGYRVVFPRPFPLWIGNVAGVVPTARATAWGVLYLVEEPGWQALDRFERVPDDYIRVTVPVSVPLCGAPALPAQTYMHVPDGSPGDLPAASYMERIRRGARAFALPPVYLKWLDEIETIPDDR